MSNLLPNKAEKRAWGAARSRMILTASLVLIGSALFSTITFIPGIVVYEAQTHALSIKATSSSGQSDGVDKKALTQAQAALVQIAPLMAATSSVDAIKALLSVRPKGISIDHISYTAGKPATISLSGSAVAPDILSAYRVALASEGHFSAVSVPIGSLIGSSNGNFTMTLMGTF